MNKKELRTTKLKERDKLSANEREIYSKRITKFLLKQEEVENAEAILCYVSYRSEVDTIPFIEDCLNAGKKVYCPKVLGPMEMDFFRIDQLADLQKGAYGIMEPIEDIDKHFLEQSSMNSCIILPGACFDKSGNRIGYGGGFYDKYLGKALNAKTIGICFSCQMTDCIVTENTDQKVLKIITENEVMDFV